MKTLTIPNTVVPAVIQSLTARIVGLEDSLPHIERIDRAFLDKGPSKRPMIVEEINELKALVKALQL